MNKRPDPLSGIDMEAALRELGDRVDFPSFAGLPATVTETLQQGDQRELRRRARGGGRFLRPLTVVACLVLAGSISVALFPTARSAIADLLGIGGVRIEFRERLPDVGRKLALGEGTTLERAEATAGFDVLVPETDLGEPDAVFVAGDAGDERVSLMYRAGRGIPETRETGVGILITQLEGIPEVPVLGKVLDEDTGVRQVQVGDSTGYWVSGAPHVLMNYRDADGDLRRQWARLSGNTLLWESGGVTIRLESELSMARALSIAESMR